MLPYVAVRCCAALYVPTRVDALVVIDAAEAILIVGVCRLSCVKLLVEVCEDVGDVLSIGLYGSA